MTSRAFTRVALAMASHGQGAASLRLTKYEMASLLGLRSQQLQQNALPHVTCVHPGESTTSIAQREARSGMLRNMRVVRHYSDGSIVRIPCGDAAQTYMRDLEHLHQGTGGSWDAWELEPSQMT